jgi:hypothetical protein
MAQECLDRDPGPEPMRRFRPANDGVANLQNSDPQRLAKHHRSRHGACEDREGQEAKKQTGSGVQMPEAVREHERKRDEGN